MNETLISQEIGSTVVCEEEQERSLVPCTIVIFGASGDLAARKLIPALLQLYGAGSLPEPFSIVGTSRSDMDDEQFRQHLKDKLHEHRVNFEETVWLKFAAHLHYLPISYDSEKAYLRLADFLKGLEREKKTGGNRIFYLAVPPSVYGQVSEMLGKVGMSLENTNGNGWSRIVVEKPFGSDLKSALELDASMHASFSEHQIFRIDHYLAKETVQNILMFRFANAIFEPVWNRGYIDYVGIIAAEKIGIEQRSGYYEQAGVIRDMFQNHMMQLLALTAMEPPSVFHSDRVQDEKIKVFRSLKPFEEARPEENLILGQYDAGSIDGAHLPAYRQEDGVSPDSIVPTFALLRLFIDNWRWRGVPFYLCSGKRMKEKITRIVVQFKEVPLSIFRNVLGETISANRLILSVYPKENIILTFQAKLPGSKICMQTVTMEFTYGDQKSSLDAYAKVLLECIEGDHMLFWRRDGVDQTWSFLDPILVECESCSESRERLHLYPAGSWGPEESMEWMNRIVKGVYDLS